VGFSCCGDALKQFVEKTGIPFILMNYGRGSSRQPPQSIWDIGNIGMMVTLAQADLSVIAACASTGCCSQGPQFRPQQRS